MIRHKILIEGRKNIKFLIIMAALIIISVIFVCTMKSNLLVIENLLISMPKEVISFLGMQELHQTAPELEMYFLLIMVFNFVLFILITVHSANGMTDDEMDGTVAFTYNQPYGRNVLFIFKAVLKVLMMMAVVIIYTILCILGLVVICKASKISGGVYYECLFKMCMRSLLLVVFFSGIGCIYSLLDCNKTIGGLSVSIFTAAVMIGNSYKLPCVIAYYMRASQVNDKIVVRIQHVLEKFVFVNPLSRLNIFSIKNGQGSMLMVIIFTLLGLAIYVGAWQLYCHRDICSND